MEEKLQALSLSNLMLKVERLRRNISDIRRKSTLHEVFKEGLRQGDLAITILSIDRYNKVIKSPNISRSIKARFIYKRDLALAKRALLERQGRPAYCVAREIKMALLQREVDMIDAIIMERTP